MGQPSVLAPLPPSVAMSRLETWGWRMALGSELPHVPRTLQAPAPFPCRPPARVGRDGSTPLQKTPSFGGGLSLGGLLAPWGPAAGSSPLPSPSLMLYGHFF